LLPINPSPSPSGHGESAAGKSSDTRQTISSTETPDINPAALVPTSTKVELVLGAADDLKDAERMLREIEVLVERGVDGSGDLACKCSTRLISLESGVPISYQSMTFATFIAQSPQLAHEHLRSRLLRLQTTHSARLASSRQLQERVIDVLGRYDDYVGVFLRH
jgi:hypothetical protein